MQAMMATMAATSKKSPRTLVLLDASGSRETRPSAVCDGVWHRAGREVRSLERSGLPPICPISGSRSRDTGFWEALLTSIGSDCALKLFALLALYTSSGRREI